MRKLLVGVLIILFFTAAAAWCQNLENAGIDYTTALQKKPGEQRIAAFESYIKNYPDPAVNVFTKLAHYWLTVDNYNSKLYDKAIKNGEKAIALGGMEAKLEAGVYLILGSSYGASNNKEKALKWAEKALDFAQKNGISDIAKQAQALKNELSGTPKQSTKPLTNLEKIGQLYNQKKFEEAINMYNSFGPTDKQDETIFEIYARSLMGANKLDAAVREFTDAYVKSRKAVNAERLGNIYLAKAKKDKKFYDQAVYYYIEASLLYKNEKNTSRQNALFKNAKYYLFEKYDFNARINKYNATVKPVKPAASNEKEIALLQREYDKLERDLARKYVDIEMPGYEQDKLDKIQQQIDKLKAANIQPSETPNSAAAQALMKEQQRIEDEFKALTEQAKKKLGLS
jgi:tetratricopeptide (TPR) repeat protein